jgi:Na+/H+ antiporter NhaC
MVLILAWSIGDAMKALGTDTYIASGVSDSVDKRAIPVLVFILSALIAMATGTSWGTMAIMFPVATRSQYLASPGDEDLMLSTIASILSGSVFGDHVSPISDTTILSSLASRCAAFRSSYKFVLQGEAAGAVVNQG